MKPTMNRKILSAFSEAARTYDQFSLTQKKIANELALIIQDQSFDRVLDAGCGTGAIFLALKDVQINDYIQLDISEAMCKKAKSLNNMQCVTADIQALPFKQNSFDLVVSSMTLQWATDLKAAIQSIHKTLRIGGIMLFSYPLHKTMHELYSIVHKNETYQSIFSTLSILCDFCKNIGFSIDAAHEKKYIEFHSSFREFCVHIKRTGVFAYAEPKINPFIISKAYHELYGSEVGIPVSWMIGYIKCIKV